MGWALVVSPLLLHALRLPLYGRLPSHDYYGALEQLLDTDGGFTTDPARWLDVRLNVHRVTLPAALWVGNVLLTGGDNRLLALLTWTLLAGLLIVLVLRLPPGGVRGSPQRWLWALPLAVLLFAPHQCYNLALAFGGIHYNLADLLAAGAMALLVARRAAGLTPVWIGLLGLAASLTFSSHLALWPALLLGALLLRLPWRRWAALAAAGGVVLALWLLSGGMPPLQARELPSLGQIAVYVTRFLGALFTREPATAALVGTVGLALSAGIQPLAWRRLPEGSRPGFAFWPMLQLYAVGNGVLAAVGRSGGEASQALTLRYATYPALFWAALAVPALALVAQWAAGEGRARDRSPAESTWRLRRLAPYGVLAVALLAAELPMLGAAAPACRFFADRGARQAVTEVGLAWSAWDEELLRHTVSRRPSKVVAMIEPLRRLSHVPFDRPPPARPAGQLDLSLLARTAPAGFEGIWDAAQPTRDPRLVRVRGWAAFAGEEVDDVLFVDGAGRRRSWVRTGLAHPTAVARLGGLGRRAGWEGYVEVTPPAPRWLAYVRLVGDPRYYPLPAAAAVGSSAPAAR